MILGVDRGVRLETVWTAVEPLLQVRGLTTRFPLEAGALKRTVAYVHAIDGVDLSLHQGEALAVIGGPGSGKTTLGRSILRLVQPAAGEVRFRGADLLRLEGSELRQARRELAMVFQDPQRSLNPRHAVAEIVAEPLDAFGLYQGRPERGRRIGELLNLVGLAPSQAHLYPHELPIEQRLRVGIARALAAEPSLIVWDEVTSTLEPASQMQVLSLLERLRHQLRLTYLFLAAGFSALRPLTGRVAVLHRGRVVEIAGATELTGRPRHPYTASLLDGVPAPEVREDGGLAAKAGQGCSFRTRCPRAQARCAESEPALDAFAADEHLAACYFPLQ